METNEIRRRLLRELVETRFNNNKAELGKFLGYKDGAFVRQMLAGERPISEKTIGKIQRSLKYAQWFDRHEITPVSAELGHLNLTSEQTAWVALLDGLTSEDVDEFSALISARKNKNLAIYAAMQANLQMHAAMRKSDAEEDKALTATISAQNKKHGTPDAMRVRIKAKKTTV